MGPMLREKGAYVTNLTKQGRFDMTNKLLVIGMFWVFMLYSQLTHSIPHDVAVARYLLVVIS